MPADVFDRQRRLLTANAYRRVFAQPERITSRHFTVLVRPNGLSRPRLGLAISRKAARRAVDRNRLKRIARESFRLRQTLLGGLDIVVMARAGAATSTGADLRSELDRLWQLAAAIEQ